LVPLEVQLRPRNDPPYQIAYFLRDGALHEYTTDFEYEHQVVLSNRGRSPLLVTSFSITTIAYDPLPSRMLVQMKFKGTFNPLFLPYRPEPVAGGRVELLAPHVRQLVPGETEIHFVKLESCPPGIYTLRAAATYLFEGRTANIEVADLAVCVCAAEARSDSVERLLLRTWRGHYSGAARVALSRPAEEWQRIAELAGEARLLYLGPVPQAEIGRGGDRSVQARVTLVPLERDDTGATLLLEQAQVVYDWGAAVGDVGPDDPLETTRLLAGRSGMCLEEYARQKLRHKVGD
jgi:hypothetical protein